MNARQTKAVSSAAEKVVSALEAAVSDPGTATNRAAAEAIIALRRNFTYDGRPDWAGRSGEYRDIIEKLYRQAGVPSDSGSGTQANLRYHIGNVLRGVAPPEDLEALGMTKGGPLARVRETRKARPAAAKGAPVVSVSDPVTLAALALDAVRTIKGGAPGPEVEGLLRQIVVEVMDVLDALSDRH